MDTHVENSSPRQVKVVHGGIAGAFSHLAAITLTQALQSNGIQSSLGSVPTFEDVVHATIREGQIGVVPIENSLAGGVFEVYELLRKEPVRVIGEIYQPVAHYLLVHPSLAEAVQHSVATSSPFPSQLKRVYSHPKAFEQCTNFLDSQPQLERVVFNNTAAAARMVAEQGDASIAAIASKESADLYGLAVGIPHIEDSDNNITRFFALTRTEAPEIFPHGGQSLRGSLVCTLQHTRGSLSELLRELAALDLNLTKIESRPIPEEPFAYYFFIDFDCPAEMGSSLSEILKRVAPHVKELKLLGAYSTLSRGN